MNLNHKRPLTHDSFCCFQKLRILSVCLTLVLLLFGCAEIPNTLTYPNNLSTVDQSKSKNIFIFMDGTANNPAVPTNVYRLYDLVKNNDDNQSVGLYIDGVGNASDPIEERLGTGLGLGMETRILTGYKFIIHNYQLNDHIFIFGFSRGAHTARSLAGLIAYAGIPKVSIGQDESVFDNLIWNSGYVFGNKIIELTKKMRDTPEEWGAWKTNKEPPLKNEISKLDSVLGKELKIESQKAEIEFLGLWDTVPGSAFKNEEGVSGILGSLFGLLDSKKYSLCKEDISNSESERYKVDSYPAIKYIAHAVANDEKRSMFNPLFLCSKSTNTNSVFDLKYTTLNEVAFPGAHADIGGGYGHKNHQLPNISLKWMVDLLNEKDSTGKERYHFSTKTQDFIKTLEGDPDGLADLSISSQNASTGSRCIDRHLPNSIVSDKSITVRNKAGIVPWVYYDIKPPKGDYSDKSCINQVVPPHWEEDTTDGAKEENIVCIEQSKLTCNDLGY